MDLARRRTFPLSRRDALLVCASVALLSQTGCNSGETGDGALYRSEEGRAQVLALYEKKLASLGFPHRSRVVTTAFGQTHVLEAGDERLPPLLALHGVHFGAPFMADFAAPLLESFRLIVPDTVGQPGRSSPVAPPPGKGNYGRWIVQVLDALRIATIPVLGTSFGGAVFLDLACLAPGRISRAALIVPGGFAVAPFTAAALLPKMLIPWHGYRLFPARRMLKHVLHPLAWEMDAFSYEYFDAILRHVRWLIPPPGPFSRQDLDSLSAPVAVYGASDDLFFPGEALLEEARRVLPNLADAAVYPSSHYPTSAMRAAVIPRAGRFLAASL